MNFDQETTQKIKEGRSKFLAMVTAYFLGNFNDNYYKQAAMLLAVASGKSHLQGTATILFSLPYVLFSSYGGWLADRFPKRKVIIATKIMELVAMIIGAIGLLAMNWTAVMVMLFIMGMQASMFSPALNGSIPELYPECYITKANAIVKLATTLAILLGIAFAGICLDQKWWETSIPFGIILVSATVVILGIIGVFCSFYTYRGEAKDPQARFPLSGPCRSVVELYRLKDRQDLLFTIICSTFFYSISALVVLNINTLGIKQLHLSQTITSLLSVALMVGICSGAFIAGKIATPHRWVHLLKPGAAGIGVGLMLIFLVPWLPPSFQVGVLSLILFGVGLCGGLYIIPVNSFIQVRPGEHEKGKIIGLLNFSDFIGIILAGELYYLLDYLLSPATSMLLLGIAALGFCTFINWALAKLKLGQ